MQINCVHLMETAAYHTPLRNRTVLKAGVGGIAELNYHEDFGSLVFVVYDDETRARLPEGHTGVDAIPLAYCKMLEGVGRW